MEVKNNDFRGFGFKTGFWRFHTRSVFFSVRKFVAFFLYIAHFLKNRRFDLHVTFFDSFNLFFRFLAEIRFRTIIKLPQKASCRTKTCSFGTSVILP